MRRGIRSRVGVSLAAGILGAGVLATPAGAAVDDICPPPGEESQNHFTDDEGNTHEDNINCAASYGLVSGQTAATYNPEGDVTRGQAATILVGYVETATGQELQTDGEDEFSDTENSVHRENIDKAADNGLISGFEDGTFKPADPIVRAQFATIIVNATEFALGQELSHDGENSFTDDDDSVHHENIEKAADNGILGGTTATTFEPRENLSRGQTATIVIQAAGNVLHPAGAWAPTAGTGSALTSATANDNDGDGTLSSGDEVVLEFNTQVATESTLTLEDGDGDQVVLTDETPVNPLADPEEVAATFEVSQDGQTVTVTVDGDPSTELSGTLDIVECSGIVIDENGNGTADEGEEPVDCAAADVTVELGQAESNQTFTVEPQDDAELTTVESGDEPDGSDDRDYAVSDPEAGTEHTIALVPAENVTRNGNVVFADENDDGEADGVGETDAVITRVNGTTTGGNDDMATAQPSSGQITFTIDYDGSDGESVVPVVWVDDGDGALAVDTAGEPTEDFGVGGATTWVMEDSIGPAILQSNTTNGAESEADVLDSGDQVDILFDDAVVVEDGDSFTVSDDDSGDGVPESTGQDTVATITLGDNADWELTVNDTLLTLTLTDDPTIEQVTIGELPPTVDAPVIITATDGITDAAENPVDLERSDDRVILGDDTFVPLSNSIVVDDADANDQLTEDDVITIEFNEPVAVAGGDTIDLEDGDGDTATLTLRATDTDTTDEAMFTVDDNVLTLTLNADTTGPLDIPSDVTAQTGITDDAANDWSIGDSPDVTVDESS